MFCDLEKGYWVFIGGGRAKAAGQPILPGVPSPSPTPTEIDIKAQRKAEDVRRKLRSRAGRAGTILTEGGLGAIDELGTVGDSVIMRHISNG